MCKHENGGKTMAYTKAAQASAVPKGKAIKAAAGGKTLLLANIDGSYYAIANACPHMGGSLADGVLEGAVIACPRHGSKFDVRTGKLVAPGRLAFIKVKVSDTVSYPVKVEGDDILADL
jgi:3-phenylpropionate/trans-cinnamate dioxygenase ferredoxin component